MSDIPALSTDIRQRLAQVRRRIRTYVWLEGLCLALVWIGVTFWLGLAVDYLPVLLGATEMPRAARIVLLVVIAAVLVYVLYRWVLRRAFARMPDRSMAVLLERRFGQFHDSLVTAVEMTRQPERAAEFNQEMLEHTVREAEARAGGVRVGEIFRLAPLVVKMALALTVVTSIGLFYALNAGAFELWVNRLYLLDDQPWPRTTHLVVAGIQIQRAESADGVPVLSPLIEFDEQSEIKVAKGTSLLLKVQADATKVIPEFCTVYYQTDEGDRGTVTMQKLGRITDNKFQTFVCDGKPFRGILSSIRFDVRGLDHRVRNYRLTVVPSPVIVSTQLDCAFPPYMVNEELSLWLPRTVELVSGTQLPLGTGVTLRCETNKDLTRVEIRQAESEETTTVDIPQAGKGTRQFEYAVAQLTGNLDLEVTLHDTDGVTSDPPIRLYVTGVEDQPPTVKTTLRGIGTAVTPDVLIPAVGEISDDYEVGGSWFEVVVNDSAPRQYPFPLQATGEVAAELDFRAERAVEGGIQLQPQDKLSITIMASDRCDLKADPNMASGDRYQLDVVTPEELLATLERKELGLRRRLEQIIEEMNEMRDTVRRLRQPSDEDAGTAPEDERTAAAAAEDPELGETEAERLQSLRLLRTQRSLAQCDKSAQEVLGVAAAFADIRTELINNRVDSKDRESRLQQQIADPLRQIGETMFPELHLRLQDVETKLDDVAASDEAVGRALEQTDAVLLALDAVLQKILELETFNELMGIIRSLIEDQNELMDKTKEKQKQGALDLLR